MNFNAHNLTRQEASYLRRLAEPELQRHQAKLSTLKLTDPPEPGKPERPYAMWSTSVAALKSAIGKLRRIENS